METAVKSDMREVFDGTNWQAEMVRSLLADAGIVSFIFDGIIGTLNPWWTAPGGAGSVRVFVPEKDFDSAKQVMKDYERNLSEV